MKILFMRTILTLLLMNVFCISYSQLNDKALLQNYKYRTKGFTAASISGTSNGNFNSSPTTFNTSGFNINPLVNGISTISTDKLLATSNCSIYTSFGTNTSNVNGIKHKFTGITLQAPVAITSKSYKGKKYFEKGIAVNPVFMSSKINPANDKTTINIASFGTMSLTFGIGKGRVENVTDMQMAYQIINALQKNKLVNSVIKESQVIELAQTITNINNRRIFDFRRKNSFALTQIDSVLHKTNVIEASSIDYFTTVADNLFFNINPYRKHGKEKYIKFQPSLITNYSESKYKGLPNDSGITYKSSNAGIALLLGIEKNIAKSIKHQFNKGVQMSVAINHNSINNNNSNRFSNNQLNTNLRGFLQWGYYPNSRTFVSTTIQNILQYELHSDNIFNTLGINFTGDYFVNYNTKLFIASNGFIGSTLYRGLTPRHQSSMSFAFGIQHFVR